MEEQRDIVYPKRDSKGLIIQSKDNSAEREVVESHNRHRFAEHFKYADLYEGNTRTYDENGNYNCGACNMVDEGICLLVKNNKDEPLEIDLKAGSCGDWEDIFAGDPEYKLNEKSIDGSAYGIAKNGTGFGCHRCPYASKANEEDSQGRTLFCGKGDFRVFPNACCAINGAPTIELDEDGDSAKEYDMDDFENAKKAD